MEYQKGTARNDILWEISKALTTGQGYVKAGVFDFFEAYLQSKGLQNYLVSFRGERIKITFVIGGAAYYHQNHIVDFLDTYCIQKNKLLNALQGVKEVLFQACFRALGIMGKLVTGPLLCIVEESNIHIFALDDTWLHVIKKLEEFATNTEPLMVGAEIVLNGVASKDEIYNVLLKTTMDTELEDLTQECLRLLCCSYSILLQRQLQDQLPKGKYDQPSQKIMQVSQYKILSVNRTLPSLIDNCLKNQMQLHLC